MRVKFRCGRFLRFRETKLENSGRPEGGLFLWHKLPFLPTITIHTRDKSGKDRTTESKSVPNREARRFPNRKKERMIMSNSNNNRINVPEAKQGMDQFKMQAANDFGVSVTY